jgi:hypothetical protein
MDFTPYITTVEDSLAAAAAAGDDETRRTATALTAALEPAMRLAIMDALAELALEVTESLGDRAVELRLEAGQVHVAVTPPEPPAESLEPPVAPGAGSQESARITLRLPESLKADAETAAARSGMSLNTWLARAVQDALRGARDSRTAGAAGPAAHRLRGFVQA